jgi:hypothetical protein
MNYPITKKCDAASAGSDTRMPRMKNSIRAIVTTALLLMASGAMAGIVFLPVGGQYKNPELATVNIYIDDIIIGVHTKGLNGELNIKGSDFPPEYDIATTAKGVLQFDQNLELVINLSTGVVEGSSSGQYINSTELWDWRFQADVRGNATCLPLNGRECGQLVVDLEVQGVLSDPNDPSIVGKLHSEILGSLVWDGNAMGHWAAMSANTTIGGDAVLINNLPLSIIGILVG